MLRVGLSGGIGSGKSTVARRLAERGAFVVDSDQVAREVVAPGSAGLDQVRQRFGSEVIGEDGALDRAALATVVGVLIEVPLMLMLVRICLRTQHWFGTRDLGPGSP